MIIQKREPSWRSALSSVSGVYLIVDAKTGKTYVGSAHGSGGIWQRWRAYVENNHGGNIKLKDLLSKEGAEYSEHFHYSVLEIADALATREQVLARESHWQDVFMSRTFGYN
jgi:GIY-YIG catalytic domain